MLCKIKIKMNVGVRRKLIQVVHNLVKDKKYHINRCSKYAEIRCAKLRNIHPKRTSCFYLHRLLAEIKYNRFLSPGEVVHHIDMNPRNNKLSNLLVLDKGQHTKLHDIGFKVKYIGCRVKGCNRKHAGLGYCSKHLRRFHKTGDPEKTKAEYGIDKRFSKVG